MMETKCGYCGESLAMIHPLNTGDGKLYCSSDCFALARPRVVTLPPQPTLVDDVCQCAICQGEEDE